MAALHIAAIITKCPVANDASHQSLLFRSLLAAMALRIFLVPVTHSAGSLIPKDIEQNYNRITVLLFINI